MAQKTIGAVFGTNYSLEITSVYLQSYVIPAWHGSPTGVSLRVTYTSGQASTQNDIRFAVYKGGTATDPTGATLVEEWVENTARADWDAPTFTLSGSYNTGEPIWVVVKGQTGSGRKLGHYTDTPDWGPSNGWFQSNSSVSNDPSVAFPSTWPTENNANGGSSPSGSWFKWEFTYDYTDISPYIDSHDDADWFVVKGQTLTITGSNYGSSKGANDHVYLIDTPDWGSRTTQVECTTSSWSDTSITLTIPNVSSWGTYYVIVVKNEGQSGEMPGSKTANIIVEEGTASSVDLSDFDSNSLGPHWQNVSGDDGDWSVVSTSQGQYSTGADADKSGSGYFVEFAGTASNQTAILEGVDTYNAANNRIYLSYWRCLHWYFSSGYDSGLLQVEAWDGSSWVVVKEYSEADTYQNASQSYVWVYEVIDLASFTNADLKIRFKHRNETGTFYKVAPAGLDEIKVHVWSSATYVDASVAVNNETHAISADLTRALSGSVSVTNDHQIIADGLMWIPVDGGATLTHSHTLSVSGELVKESSSTLDTLHVLGSTPSLLIQEGAFLQQDHTLDVVGDGGTPVSVPQNKFFDICDEVITDIAIPSTVSSKAKKWEISFNVEYQKFCGEEFAEINAGILDSHPVNECQEQPLLFNRIEWEVLTSYTVVRGNFELLHTYERVPDLQALPWELDQEHSIRYARIFYTQEWETESSTTNLHEYELTQNTERALDLNTYDIQVHQTYKVRYWDAVYTQEWELESSTTNLYEFELQHEYNIFGRDGAYGFLQVLNDYRVSRGEKPVTLWCDRPKHRRSVNIAFEHSKNMAYTDTQEHNSTNFPVGWQTADERLEHMKPEGAADYVENLVQSYSQPAWVAEGYDNSNPKYSGYKPTIPEELLEAWKGSPLHNSGLLWPVKSGVEYALLFEVVNHNKPNTDSYHATISSWATYLLIWYMPDDAEMSTFEITQEWAVDHVPVRILTQEYLLESFTPVRQRHETTYALRVAAQHETISGCRVAAQHVAPIHYSITVSHETLYEPTVPVVTQHEATYRIWDTTPVVTDHAATYSLRVSAQHEAVYEGMQSIAIQHEAQYQNMVHVRNQHEAQYEDRIRVRNSHEDLYSSMVHVRQTHEDQYTVIPRVAVQHEAEYSAMVRVAASHESNYGAMVYVQASHEATYSLRSRPIAQHETLYNGTIGVAQQHSTDYDLQVLNRVQNTLTTFWSLLSETVQVIPNTTTVTVGSNAIDAAEILIARSEDDVLWRVRMVVRDMADFSLFTEGTAFEVDLVGDVYKFLYDTKSINRSGPGSVVLTVDGLSPAMMLKAPRATLIDREYDTAWMAHAMVEDILGQTVVWEIPDWSIPAYRVAATQAEPLGFAASLVAEVGAVLESDYDGTLRVRKKYVTNLPDYPTATVDHTYTDIEDNLSSIESYERRIGYNYFRITEADSSYADVIEFVEDEDDALRGKLRAYPSPWRENVRLRTTDGSGVVFLDTGSWQERLIEDEIVEIVEGSGSLSYPAKTIHSIEWLSVSLGGITHIPYTTELTTGVTVNEGYGLARITYTARYLESLTYVPASTTVQYILENI